MRTLVTQGMAEGLGEEMAESLRVCELSHPLDHRGKHLGFVLQCKARLGPLGGTCEKAGVSSWFNRRKTFLLSAALGRDLALHHGRAPSLRDKKLRQKLLINRGCFIVY